MKFYETKEILKKMEFLIRMAKLDMDAAEVQDISQQRAETEIKKMYVAMRIWMLRLSETVGMGPIPVDKELARNDEEGMVQLSLFDLDDLS